MLQVGLIAASCKALQCCDVGSEYDLVHVPHMEGFPVEVVQEQYKDMLRTNLTIPPEESPQSAASLPSAWNSLVESVVEDAEVNERLTTLATLGITTNLLCHDQDLHVEIWSNVLVYDCVCVTICRIVLDRLPQDLFCVVMRLGVVRPAVGALLQHHYVQHCKHLAEGVCIYPWSLLMLSTAALHRLHLPMNIQNPRLFRLT